MRCTICQTTPCQVLTGNLAQNAAWLFSEEAEQVLTSGEWNLLFEHLSAQVSEPEVSAEQGTRKGKMLPLETMHRQSEQASLLPSQTTEDYWIRAYCAQLSETSYDGEKVGKWLVFVHVAHVDAAWNKIKGAVEQGRLGRTAKVATAKKNPLALNPEERVICVYTDDWTDEYEVRRIHAELHDLGFTWPMSYKTNQDTKAGIYKRNGHTNIGVYRFYARDAHAFKAGKYAFLKKGAEEP